MAKKKNTSTNLMKKGLMGHVTGHAGQKGGQVTSAVKKQGGGYARSVPAATPAAVQGTPAVMTRIAQKAVAGADTSGRPPPTSMPATLPPGGLGGLFMKK